MFKNKAVIIHRVDISSNATERRIPDFLKIYGKTNVVRDWDMFKKLNSCDLALTHQSVTCTYGDYHIVDIITAKLLVSSDKFICTSLYRKPPITISKDGLLALLWMRDTDHHIGEKLPRNAKPGEYKHFTLRGHGIGNFLKMTTKTHREIHDFYGPYHKQEDRMFYPNEDGLKILKDVGL